jgi:hypothetical protein
MGLGRFITTIVLFIVLSPGVLLNLPGVNIESDNVFMSIINPFRVDEGWGFNKESVLMTKQTTLWSILVHALVFALIMGIVNKVTEKFEDQQEKEDTVMDTLQGWWNRATEAVGMNA